MSKLRVLLVDDEQDSLEVLEMMLNGVDQELDIVAKCRSANDAIEKIQIFQPDLLFLDIEMPVNDGFTVLRAFENPSFRVIIVTGYEQYALRAIKFAAVDYLLKPIDLKELNLALNKVVNSLSGHDPRMKHLAQTLREDSEVSKLIIPSNKGFSTIHLNDIVTIESMPGGYCLFRLSNNSTSVVTKPLTYFEDILPRPKFYRVHRSNIINLDFVRSYESHDGIIHLENGRDVEVSVRRRPEFHMTFKEYIIG